MTRPRARVECDCKRLANPYPGALVCPKCNEPIDRAIVDGGRVRKIIDEARAHLRATPSPEERLRAPKPEASHLHVVETGDPTLIEEDPES